MAFNFSGRLRVIRAIASDCSNSTCCASEDDTFGLQIGDLSGRQPQQLGEHGEVVFAEAGWSTLDSGSPPIDEPRNTEHRQDMPVESLDGVWKVACDQVRVSRDVGWRKCRRRGD